jgi:hypothetical protein
MLLRLRRSAWAFLLVVLLCSIVHSTPYADALSCAPPPPVEEEFASSSVVFAGKVLKANKDGLAVFRVEKAWKGVTGPDMEIYDNDWDPFQIGERYLVFGADREGELRMNLCGRTRIWYDSHEQVFRDAGIEPVYVREDDILPVEVTRPETGTGTGAGTGTGTGISSAQVVLLVFGGVGIVVLVAVRRARARQK